MAEDNIKYETGSKRVIASLIDSIIVSVPFVVILANTVNSNDPFRINFIGLLVGILQSVLFVTYSIVSHYKYGQTIGKKIMDIKVMDLDEVNTITFKQAFLRDIVLVVFAFFALVNYTLLFSNISLYNDPVASFFIDLEGNIGFYWAVAELITMLTNKKRRAIHDYIAKTIVINVSDEKLKMEQ